MNLEVSDILIYEAEHWTIDQNSRLHDFFYLKQPNQRARNDYFAATEFKCLLKGQKTVFKNLFSICQFFCNDV